VLVQLLGASAARRSQAAGTVPPGAGHHLPPARIDVTTGDVVIGDRTVV